jgi:hypothetical protein
VKSTSNPYVKRIAALVGEKESTRALQLFVDAHRSPGESLSDLARRLGVSRIMEQKLPFEGGLFQLRDGELVIRLNCANSFVRKRFTLAHEIGHLLLNTVPARRSSNRADEELERTCDLIAAELLMPARETTDFVRRLGSPSTEKLREIASKFAVSLQSAAIRVRDGLKLWKCSVGMWELSPKFKILWFAGPRRWRYVQPTLSCLELALTSKSPIRTDDRWQQGAFSERVWLDLLGIGPSRVLALVDFTKEAKPYGSGVRMPESTS